MRVITGSARGISLDVPEGDLRPTMDRVREAVFSSLGDAVPDARVLDLFAGSGALAIEALSRGAREATMVDANRESAICMRRNLTRTRLEANVQTMDAFKFLELYAREGGYDLIFADPPYTKHDSPRDFAAELVASPHLAKALAPHGTVILECSVPPAIFVGLELLKLKRYGKSRIAYLTKSAT